MSKLTAAQRNRIAPGNFGVYDKRTGTGKYPMPDASHAANAKSRATQQVAAGNLSPASKAEIDRKANAVLNKGESR